MKRIFILMFISILLIFTFFSISNFVKDKNEKERIKKLKEGWHVEITNDYINIRKDADKFSDSMGTVLKGEFYEVLEVDTTKTSFNWYKLKLEDNRSGWIANPKRGGYLLDNNNPNDIAIPTIKYEDSEYKVNSIKDVNYDHLILWDDKEEFTVSHVVYHEIKSSENIDQYWINYTITDKVGKSSSKLQKIIFKTKPNQSEVTDFALYKR